ncbi:type II toxin-antitoxin system VapC family toxin [Arabiibacter massiliensis]|uniref:type II toxin-antitoxin system VapC family toxin n=1 Tax=Arabiibacter massiliensis TaxID=1870985 RepID=UPI0009BB4CF2|nr:type II toxin-antitoxin system VapC family toxin [Arabiibacter massiliensis]
MKYVADTNVVSELMKRDPSPDVVDWFFDHEGEVLLTAITVKELYFGMLRLPDGRRKRALEEAITAIVMDCADMTLPFDAFSAYLCARMHEAAVASGRTPTIEDLMIAAICQRNDAVLATRNTKDFDFLGIELVNSFDPR